MAERELSHVDERGQARMVDVGDKDVTERLAVAEAFVEMSEETLALIQEGSIAKGDVFAVARVAGIAAAKKTADLIPLCHPLSLTHAEIELAPGEQGIRVVATVRTRDRTGVEMEALAGASVAALAIYDMCKAVERGIVVRDVRLMRKEGGKSGSWSR
jgi:cyclic pyranopterin phosphate synthase